MKPITNKKARDLTSQAIVLFLLALFVVWGMNNAVTNLEKSGISSGFDFLKETAGFEIAQTLIPFDRNSTYLDAFVVGLLNTILVSIITILVSTLLGFSIGVARLSDNYLLKKLSSIYIGTVRNIPLLLQLLFWYIAVLSPLPGPRDAYHWAEKWFLSNRGLISPAPIFSDTAIYMCWSLIIAIIGLVFFWRWANRFHEKTGVYLPKLAISLAVIVSVILIAMQVLNNPVTWGFPKLKGFNFEGGITLMPELIALIVALSIYASAFIAENVRAGILSVGKGQTEAAQSLGLSKSKTMKLITIPLAMRIIIPPLTSQHLTTVKNSSLAVVIGYPDLMHVFAGTSLNQSGQAVEIVSITMLVYLLISLAISYAMNVFNNKMKLKER